MQRSSDDEGRIPAGVGGAIVRKLLSALVSQRPALAHHTGHVAVPFYILEPAKMRGTGEDNIHDSLGKEEGPENRPGLSSRVSALIDEVS